MKALEVLTERWRRRGNDAGFTLMELLIVISIMLILMLIAIPNMLNLKATANETSAKQSLRAIQEAETQYATNFPANGFACSLAALGGNASSGAPNPQASQLLQGDLAGGEKAGYQLQHRELPEGAGQPAGQFRELRSDGGAAGGGQDRPQRLLPRHERRNQGRSFGGHELHGGDSVGQHGSRELGS